MQASSVNRVSHQITLSVLGLLILFCLLPLSVEAQGNCGFVNYIDVGNGYVEYLSEINDCDNPFEVVIKDDSVQTIRHSYEGTELKDGGVLIVDTVPSPAAIISVAIPQRADWAVLNQLFYHEGDTYVTYENTPTNYVQLFHATGTYTLVSTVLEAGGPIFQTQRNWFDAISEWILPVVHANTQANVNFSMPVHQTQITFTVELAKPEPTGASSVLFLPGIQASRLYTAEPDGTEKLLWEPDFLFDDADVLRLAMTSTGESIEDIYVRDVIDYAPSDNPSAETAVYGGFLQFLDELVVAEDITEYSAFAYDWRYDVFDIVTDGVQYKDGRKFLVEEVERLAAESASGKVAVVAHSNGGLLGKALIDELDSQGKVDLVESFTMIGTPQLGTPKAIGSLLHGTDQGLNWDRFENIQPPIITDKAVREAARNMPGAYGLLPGQAYYAAAGDVLVLFDTGVSTEPWRSSYGNALQSEAELNDFLTSTANSRDNVPFSNTDRAIVANQTLLDKARSTRHQLDTWQSPEDIAVTSITGTGLSTISGFEYVTISERFCAGSICTPINFYRPKAIQSFRGDQTVITVSGEGGSVAGQARYYVDLLTIRQNFETEYIHKNLTETDLIQDLIVDLLFNTDVETNQFINQTGFTYPDQQLFTYGGNSPVYLLVTDDQGRRTGQLDATTIVEEIPGSRWFAIGGATYVSVPTNVDHTVTMQAYNEGSVTLTVDEVTDDQQVLLYVAPIPIITSDTSIELVYQNESFGQIQVDLDGDGEVDEIRDVTGGQIVISPEPEEIADAPTVENTSNSSTGTRIADRTAVPQVLGVSISSELSSEQFQAIATALKDIESFLATNQLTIEQTSELTNILEGLLRVLPNLDQ